MQVNVPLSKLSVAPENARASNAVEELDSLAANIESYGLLQPLIAYAGPRGTYLVVGGRRRLAALRKIEANEAAVVVIEKDAARAASLAENEQRVAMHPLDAAAAWKKMVDDGAEPAKIALAFGVSERLVLQRVALANLIPEIAKALRSGDLPLAAAEAYASAAPERQRSLWKRLGKNATRRDIREEIAGGNVEATDRLAVFVGEAAYRAAGGRIEVDLFANSETPDPDEDFFYGRKEREPDGLWIDRDLVEKLAAEKIEATCEKLRAEGWGFVETGEHFPWGKYRENVAHKTKEEKAKAGCFVSLDHAGKLAIKRGLARAKGGSSVPTAPAIGSGGKKGVAAKKAKQPPMTNAAHEIATRVAGKILGRAMANDPSVALIALAAQLARQEFEIADKGNGYVEQTVLAGIASMRDFGRQRRVPCPIKTDAASDAEAQEWERRVKSLQPDIESGLAEWPDGDVLKLLGFLIGRRVLIVEDTVASNPYPARRAKAAALGRIAGVRPSVFWTPSKEWLVGCSRETLAKIARELEVPVVAKKGALAEAIAAKAARVEWVPPLVVELLGAGETRAPAKAKKGAKR